MLHTLTLPRHTFALRSIPRSSLVMTNIEYRAIQAIDCQNGEVAWTLDFPEGLDDFAIQSWYVAPDGQWSFAIDDDDRTYGVAFDHHQRRSTRIELPVALGIPSGTCWFGPQLQFVTFDGMSWSLKGDVLELAPPLDDFMAWGQKLEAQHPGYRQYNQIRTDFGDGLAYFLSNDATLCGFATIPDGELYVVEGDQDIIDLAQARDSLFIAYEKRIMRREGDRLELFFEPAQNERINAMATVNHDDRPLLVLLTRVSGGDWELKVIEA